MASNRVYKFKDIQDTQAFLNGALFGGPVLSNLPVPMVRNIIGKTFKIGATTVTFVAAPTPPDGDPYALLFADIKAQVEAAVATVKLFVSEGRIGIIEVTPLNGVTVDKIGTANTAMGFDTAVNSVSKVYKPAPLDPTPPCWVWIETLDTTHIVYTWE